MSVDVIGALMPHIELLAVDGPTSSTELLRAARGVLLDLADSSNLCALARRWADRIDIVSCELNDPPAEGWLAGVTGILIRPDGHVVWVSHGDHDIERAMRRWFGEPKLDSCQVAAEENQCTAH